MSVENAYAFRIKGYFGNIASNNIEVADAPGNVVGFLLPDGRTAQLVMALEIISADGSKAEYITKESEMTDIGFDVLEYDYLVFEKE